MKMNGKPHDPAALPPGKNAGTHCIGGWVGSRAGLEVLDKSLSPMTGFDPRPFQSDARTPYRLHCSGLISRKHKYFGSRFSGKMGTKAIQTQHLCNSSRLGKLSLKISIHSDPSSGNQQYLTTECNISMPRHSSLSGLMSTSAMNHVFLPSVLVIANNLRRLIANYLKK